MKNKIALFDLTGCEGCEFHMLSLNEKLLEVFEDFEVTNWRLLSEDQKSDFDIAFIEGAATTDEHVILLKEIRETSKYVVAIGACAINGNVFAEITPEQREKLTPIIYDKEYQLKAKFLDPVEKHIKVDYKVPGCAPSIEILQKLLEQFKQEEVTSKIHEVQPLNYVSKIEGHGSLKINFNMHQVSFEVEESERFVEALVQGKNIKQAPFVTARICGICPVAHNIASWGALEDALHISLSQEAVWLRELILTAQVVKSHLLHLFFLVLPDYMGEKSSIALSQKYPQEFNHMLEIKRASEKVLEVVMGSTAFPVFTTLGGFSKVPDREVLKELQKEVQAVIDTEQMFIDLFGSFEYFPLNTKINFLTLDPQESGYPLYSGTMNQKIIEVVSHTSSAKLGYLENGEMVKVGAMARMFRFHDKLHERAKAEYQELQPNLHNPFTNNIAQAIEIMHYLEEMYLLLGKLGEADLEKAKPQDEIVFPEKEAFGSFCVEAPRGMLIHEVTVDSEGKIANYNLIPPTQINLASLKKEAEVLVHSALNLDEQDLKKEVEKLIRAFDPCITCAVH